MSQREEGVPVGLKNVGNTCYFNSLIQSYLTIPNLVIHVLEFKPDPSHFAGDVPDAKKEAIVKIVQEL
jgi:ubiquitin carboxyl-terminal hydrolase 25/28